MIKIEFESIDEIIELIKAVSTSSSLDTMFNMFIAAKDKEKKRKGPGRPKKKDKDPVEFDIVNMSPKREPFQGEDDGT